MLEPMMVRKSLPGLGIRWTIGDVSDAGRDALRYSILGAWKVFGPSASYVVCVNSCDADALRRYLGERGLVVILPALGQPKKASARLDVKPPPISTDKTVTYDYDIVYVRAPRRGDDVQIAWAEVFSPTRAEPERGPRPAGGAGRGGCET